MYRSSSSLLFRSHWLKPWLKAVSAQTPWVLGNLSLTQGQTSILGDLRELILGAPVKKGLG